uniref:Uncharacterized protein n=1 Tax=Bursaphelenchus xylophilus TaxID=6326 RepID=A0A1I7SCE4_BURXY
MALPLVSTPKIEMIASGGASAPAEAMNTSVIEEPRVMSLGELSKEYSSYVLLTCAAAPFFNEVKHFAATTRHYLPDRPILVAMKSRRKKSSCERRPEGS